LPLTGVNPLQRFIRPALRAIRVDAHKRFETPVFLKARSQALKGWADEVSSGTYHRSGNKKTHPSPIGSGQRGELEKLQSGFL